MVILCDLKESMIPTKSLYRLHVQGEVVKGVGFHRQRFLAGP